MNTATAPALPSFIPSLGPQPGVTSLDAWKEQRALERGLANLHHPQEAEISSGTTVKTRSYCTAALTLPFSDQKAERQFASLFQASTGLVFEDGMESEFSGGLIGLVRAYGALSKDILAGLFEDKSVTPEVVSEALRWLGRMEDPQSYEARLWLIERALSSPAPSVRDGALLGLSSMDDPRAIRYLEIAAQREELPELRNDMLQVLSQLSSGR